MGKGEKQKETPSLENQVFGITVKKRRWKEHRHQYTFLPYSLQNNESFTRNIWMCGVTRPLTNVGLLEPIKSMTPKARQFQRHMPMQIS